jgi:hypothetical protein
MISPETRLYYILYWMGERKLSRAFIYEENFLPKYYSDRTSAYSKAVELQSENIISGVWEIVKSERRNIITEDWID